MIILMGVGLDEVGGAAEVGIQKPGGSHPPRGHKLPTRPASDGNNITGDILGAQVEP